MSDYTNYITDVGKVVLNRALAQERIVITKAIASSMTHGSPDKITNIIPESQIAKQVSVLANGEYAEINAVFDCSDLDTGYELNMIGIYGKAEGETEDTLIYVSVFDESSKASISAHSAITFYFKFITSLSVGSLIIQTSDEYSCPISHLSDNSRHLLTQINSDTENILINSGTYNSFSDGQVFIFLPKVDINSEANLVIAGNSYPLISANLNRNNITNNFTHAIPYGITYSNGSFIYQQNDMLITLHGVVHYWNGAMWKTTERAGEIKAFDTNIAPAGFLLCDGSSLTTSDYPELFEVIGYRHGGNGEYFNLPDLRGRVLISSSASHVLASTGGAETHQLTSNEMPSHSHTIQHTHRFSYTNYPPTLTSGLGLGQQFFQLNLGGQTATGQTAGIYEDVTSGSAGRNTAHNNMQPFMVINYFISTGRSLI